MLTQQRHPLRKVFIESRRRLRNLRVPEALTLADLHKGLFELQISEAFLVIIVGQVAFGGVEVAFIVILNLVVEESILDVHAAA